MKATNTLAPEGRKTFSQFMMQNSVNNLIKHSLGSPDRAANFVSTLISICDASPQLKMCESSSILSAALRGEGMNLSLALGHYGIVPYGTRATFQIMAKGLSQMAIRTGQYVDFDVFDVREGEYKGRDPRTRRPVIEWIEDENVRESLPLAGFYGFYELQTGFFKSLYWSHEKILQHANRYSKAFDIEKYNELLAGNMRKEDAERLRGGSPWYDEPLSEAHMKMCKKTVLIQLLNDGKAPLSTELQTAIINDEKEDDSANIVVDAVPVSETVSTAEAATSETAVSAESEPTPAPAPAPVPEEKVVDVDAETVDKPRRGRKPKADDYGGNAAPKAKGFTSEPENLSASFFGDEFGVD